LAVIAELAKKALDRAQTNSLLRGEVIIRAVGGLTVFLKSYGRVFAFKSTCEEEAQ
jgi:hypothetical protein